MAGSSTSQLHVGVSRSRICLHSYTCCHTKLGVADQTSYPTQSHRVLTPHQPVLWPSDARRSAGHHWSTSVEVVGMTGPEQSPTGRAGVEPRSPLQADALPLGQRGPLTLGEPVPAVVLQRQAPVRVAMGVPNFRSLMELDLEYRHIATPQ